MVFLLDFFNVTSASQHRLGAVKRFPTDHRLQPPKEGDMKIYVHRFQPDPIKQWNMFFSSKKWKKCKPKKQPEKKNKSKSKKKCKKMHKKNKTKKNTKAKAKGTYKKQNFKFQSVFGCKSKYLTSCKQIFKLPAASKKNMEQKLIPSILTMIMM